MTADWVALGVLTLLLLAHFVSMSLALRRYTRSPSASRHRDPVTIVRPVCGVDHYDRGTLASTFFLDHPDYEVIFCCAKTSDPAVKLVNELIAQYPHVPARLLIGDDRPTSNPKLNNIIKGWNAAKHDWIVLADSNVILPPDYLERLTSNWRSDTGLVCSPPLGCLPHSFWAEVECAFLNGYQARWQSAADSAGFGFAQGKSMLWQREMLEQAGGIVALGAEIAEDAAATKIVRANGKRVRLVDQPFEQPLGVRSAKQVFDRQLRWAKLRRATFAPYYAPEVLTGILTPVAAACIAASAVALDPLVASGCVITLWYLPEAMLTRAAGWHFSWQSPIAWLVRDVAIPLVWVGGWMGNAFNWRGNDMNVLQPRELVTNRASSG